MENKKNKKDLNNEGRYTNVLLENMDSKIDIILEGHHILDKKIDDLKIGIDESFNEVDYKFETVFDELRLIRSELKEKVGRDEFFVLEKRVSALEKKR
ncbi:hypothetical protein KJ763_01275 [Patescibacteria group bacterium]|nr:hypothetical protein [Patescibacteria group bacterium]